MRMSLAQGHTVFKRQSQDPNSGSLVIESMPVTTLLACLRRQGEQPRGGRASSTGSWNDFQTEEARAVAPVPCLW